MKKKVATALLASAFVLASLAPAAFADPNFGAGASGGGPKAPNAKCHPPGQTSDLAQCR